MTRIVAESAAQYDAYHITGRVYRDPIYRSTFRVIVMVQVDGKFYATSRETVQGEYWARRAMFLGMADAHGHY